MGALTEDQVREYWERGFLHVPGLFDAADIRRLQAECDRLTAAGSTRPADSVLAAESFPRHAPAGQLVRNLIDPVVPHSRLVRELLRAAAVVDTVRALLRDEPRLFKDKLILRPPGTTGYGLHQDFAYWGWTGVPADDLLALQIAIDDADATNGAVELYPGLHHALLPPTASDGNDIAEDRVRAAPELIPTKAGDALAFHSLTPHRSGVNRSQRFRRTLYLTYNAARSGDLYRIYYQDRGDVLAVDAGGSG